MLYRRCVQSVNSRVWIGIIRGLSPLEQDGDHGKDHSAEAILDGVRFPVPKMPKRALPWQRGHCVKSEMD